MTYSRKHIGNSKEKAYYQTMVNHLRNGDKLNRPKTEKLAKSLGINDRTLIKELTELAIVITAREIALGPGSQFDKYNAIVELYKNQTNLSFRTSQSILLQQYSTPAPIGYLMGLYCGIDSHTKSVFEPSAGNGLLTIAASPRQVTVNEIPTPDVAFETTDVSCFGDIDGSISLITDEAIMISLDGINYSSTNTIDNLSVGEYLIYFQRLRCYNP